MRRFIELVWSSLTIGERVLLFVVLIAYVRALIYLFSGEFIRAGLTYVIAGLLTAIMVWSLGLNGKGL